ncbi:MAG: hypothetical protein KatS3mg092_0416 [Patescibacteria group bacterium]|nr:MAG: hypothetical protein KatS3mg092_0416 [Patescibacteria group bacterium]
MPITIHFSKRSYLSYLKQLIREKNFSGLYNWGASSNFNTDPLYTSIKIINILFKTGGYFHLFGHSWEIEQQNLWQSLEKLFKIISYKSNILYITNSEVLKWIKKGG